MKQIVALLILFIFSTGIYAKNSAEYYLNKLPAVIDGFTADKKHNYEDERLGSSILFYKNAGDTNITVTLYVYDYGINQISQKDVVEAFSSAKAEVKTMEARGYYRGVVIGDDEQYKFKFSDATEAIASSVEYSYIYAGKNKQRDENVVSNLIVTDLHGYLVKLRATAADDGIDRRQSYKKFFKWALNYMNK